MKHVAFAARTLFPVDGYAASRRSDPDRSSSLRRLVAVMCAVAPLLVLVDAVVRTA